MAKREELERRWRLERDKLDRSANPTAAMIHAEEQSWEAVSAHADENGECKQPGCRKPTPEYAYCEVHRVK
jgi:hypothetical protein